MEKLKLVAIAVSLAALAMPASASVELVTNGGFEIDPVTNSDGFTTFSSGAQGLTGWTIGLGSVDLVGSYWSAASGNNSLDLNGNTRGGIRQLLQTTTGQLYQLSFDMAGNFASGPAIKRMSVNVDAVSYTHLDVYKRQAWARRVIGVMANRLATCLLYTSRCV